MSIKPPATLLDLADNPANTSAAAFSWTLVKVF